MIYNRTIEDVNKSKEIVEKIKKNISIDGFELTNEEKDTLERGTVTINTLNRIEKKQKELQKKINEMGYFDTNIENKEWSYEDIFFGRDISRIFGNARGLRNAFYVFFDTPIIKNTTYHYLDFNDLEKNLADLEEMVDIVKSKYRHCGTFECGDVNRN